MKQCFPVSLEKIIYSYKHVSLTGYKRASISFVPNSMAVETWDMVRINVLKHLSQESEICQSCSLEPKLKRLPRLMQQNVNFD